MDIDTLNQIKAEERQYEQWQINERNRILRVSDQKRKQEMWNKLFPKAERLSVEEMNQVVVW